jgi:hypothetical protein
MSRNGIRLGSVGAYTNVFCLLKEERCVATTNEIEEIEAKLPTTQTQFLVVKSDPPKKTNVRVQMCVA